MSKTVKLIEDNFENEVLKSDIPVLVDFWADWCGPCRVLGPVIEEIAEEYDGKLKVGKLHVDENPTIASKYNIRGIPTMIIFRDGKQVDQLVGALPKNDIRNAIDGALNWKLSA